MLIKTSISVTQVRNVFTEYLAKVILRLNIIQWIKSFESIYLLYLLILRRSL